MLSRGYAVTWATRHPGKWILGVYNPACLVTLSGLLASIAAIVLATRGMYELAMVGLIFAGIADLFDGFIARRLQLNSFAKEYGVQLDTVVDIIAFVVAPLVIALHVAPATGVGLLILAWFVVAGVVRLAHFNTLSMRGADQSTFHRGLPVTYTALIFPLFFILLGKIPIESISQLLTGLFALVGFLFVVNVPVPKPRGLFYIILPLLAVGLTVYWVGRHLHWFSAT
jgi:CDP-diacylglycerol--serine O-phosphatidyltransferase